MRSKTGAPPSRSVATGGTLAPHAEAGEAPDDDVLLGLLALLVEQLADGPAVVLVAVDVDLVEQHDVLEPLLDLALGDARADVLGLVGGLLLEDPHLGLAGLLGNLLLGDVLRARRGYVQSDVAGEGNELLVAGHEVRLAVDLHQHADPVV